MTTMSSLAVMAVAEMFSVGCNVKEESHKRLEDVEEFSSGTLSGKMMGTRTSRIIIIFDSDGNFLLYDLFHGKWMYDFGSIIGEFCRFLRCHTLGRSLA